MKVGLVPVSQQQAGDPRADFGEPTHGEIVSAVATIQKAQNPLSHGVVPKAAGAGGAFASHGGGSSSSSAGNGNGKFGGGGSGAR